MKAAHARPTALAAVSGAAVDDGQVRSRPATAGDQAKPLHHRDFALPDRCRSRPRRWQRVRRRRRAPSVVDSLAGDRSSAMPELLHHLAQMRAAWRLAAASHGRWTRAVSMASRNISWSTCRASSRLALTRPRRRDGAERRARLGAHHAGLGVGLEQRHRHHQHVGRLAGRQPCVERGGHLEDVIDLWPDLLLEFRRRAPQRRLAGRRR